MSTEFFAFADKIFSAAAASIAVISVMFFAFSALRSGVIKNIKFGPLQLDAGISKEEVDQISNGISDKRPFEVKALSNYYNQALSRATVSFWFSLIFASIGFGVIIFSFITHDSGNYADTALKIVSGTVIDAVSALFFIQSTNAQKSMGDFFEKLRLDRLNVEARELISEIENEERRDQLRAQLVIKYAGIDKLIVG